MGAIILFMIFSLCQASILWPDDIIDGNGNGPINQCVHYQTRCNPHHQKPCCEENNTCRLVRLKENVNVSACLGPVQLGEYCRNDLSCWSIDHAICNSNNECECGPGFAAVTETKCTRVSIPCWRDDDCVVKNSVCINNECTCKPEFVSYFKDHCEPKLLGMTCNNDYDCKDSMHMKCSENKTCTCRPDHIIKNNATCAPLLGGYCQHDEECAVNNSACIDNKCQCKANLKSISNDNCVPTKFGNSCSDILDCEDVLHLFCSENHRCECKKNNIIMNNSTCLPLLDEYCWSYEKCAPANSVCLLNTCQCKPNYLQKSNNQCIPKKLGQSCESNDDCQELLHAECSENKICACRKNNIILENSKCVPVIGGFCDDNNLCFPRNSVCINNECQYREGFPRRPNGRIRSKWS